MFIHLHSFKLSKAFLNQSHSKFSSVNSYVNGSLLKQTTARSARSISQWGYIFPSKGVWGLANHELNGKKDVVSKNLIILQHEEYFEGIQLSHVL